MSMNLEEMQTIRNQLKLSYAEIAKASNVPAATVQKVFAGDTARPRRWTWVALENAMEHFREALLMKDSGSITFSSARSHKGYTLTDYYALPASERKELIDGKFYDMSSPSTAHQRVIARLYFLLTQFITDNHGSCEVLLSPLDVILDDNDSTCVQPDLMVVCDASKIKKDGVHGAPDLIVEVLSASNKRHDMVLKLAKYSQSGVREYWMVDLEKQRTIVYRFDEDVQLTIYGADAPIPVSVFENKLSIQGTDFLYALS